MPDARALAKALAEAAQLVEGLPDDLRQTAFAKMVDLLLGLPGTAPSLSEVRRTDPKTRRDSHEELAANMFTLDRTAFPEVLESRTVLEQALLILRAARTTAGIEWLPATEITRVLKEQFRIRISKNAVGMALSRAPKYVDRRSKDGAIEYRLMAPGEKFLDTPRNERSKGKSPPQRRKAAGPTTTRVQGGRPPPTRLLEELVAGGFFATPKMLTDIVTYIAEKKAHRFGTNDLSKAMTRLTRAGVLVREKSSSGTFAYQTPPRGEDPYLKGIMERRR